MATRNSEERPVDLPRHLCGPRGVPIDTTAEVIEHFVYGVGVEEMRAELEHRV